VDLTQMTRAHVLAPASPPALDATAALRAGHDAGAHYVVFGAAQSSGTQVRVTGQVLDVSTGQSLANLKATAPADDLFPLEDALAVQVVRALPGSPAPTTAPAETAQQPPPLPQVINEQPYVSEVTPAPQYDTVPGSGYGAYSYPPYPYYGYPYYYPYPYWGFFGGAGVVITGHHFHDHVNHGYYPGYGYGPYMSPHVNPGIYNRGVAHGAARGPGLGAMPGRVGGGIGAARGNPAGGMGHAGGGGARGR